MDLLTVTCTVCVLFLTCCSGTRVDLTVRISPGKLDCFWQHAPADTNVELDYRVLYGGALDINAMVVGSESQVYFNDYGKNHDSLGFKSDSEGDFKICFDNTFTILFSKIVFFEIYVEDGKDDNETNGNSGVTFEEESIREQLNITVDELLGILERSKKNTERSSQMQTIIKINEALHRSIQEANFFLINYFAFVQLFIMVSSAACQVLLIQSLFLDNKPTSRASLKAKT
ncbi:unnamed protein product [Candidula unifasciata]|uniref:GOLD domain-containing protein n=1 Tax=Candidula unifasciata TaxID=100452 RepID=A0A8S3Z0V0_9EUPU|nr:unnamed protein product [Candidula unifasciata]